MPTQGPSQTDPVERALAKHGIEVFSSITEAENTAYGAQILHTSVGTVRVREGRVTPTKPGVFVAVWRRLEAGETGPFPDDDGID